MSARRILVLVLVLGALLAVPVATAAPMILPTSSSAYAVAATDYFEFRLNTNANAIQSGVSWRLTGPDGSTMVIQASGTDAISITDVYRFSLDGSQAS